MSQGGNHRLIQFLHQPANHGVIFKLANIVNSSNTSKNLFSICYSKNCSNVATMAIKLPINEKLACIINVCKECIPKFLKNKMVVDDDGTNASNIIHDTRSSSQKSIQRSTTQDYTFCDQCAWNGFPNEKIVRIFHGLRPEDEDGFIYRFTEYDYDPLDKSNIKHVHKYDQKIIDEHVRIALENQKGVNDAK